MFIRIIFISCGLAVYIISFISLLGHLFKIIKFYQWKDSTGGMASNTAVCLCCIGICFILLGFCNRFWNK